CALGGGRRPRGSVAAAIDHPFDGPDTESAVAHGTIVGDRGRGVQDVDAVAPRADDIVAADQGAFGHAAVDRYPARASIPHDVATDHIAHRLSTPADGGDQDAAAVAHQAIADAPAAV